MKQNTILVIVFFLVLLTQLAECDFLRNVRFRDTSGLRLDGQTRSIRSIEPRVKSARLREYRSLDKMKVPLSRTRIDTFYYSLDSPYLPTNANTSSLVKLIGDLIHLLDNKKSIRQRENRRAVRDTQYRRTTTLEKFRKTLAVENRSMNPESGNRALRRISMKNDGNGMRNYGNEKYRSRSVDRIKKTIPNSIDINRNTLGRENRRIKFIRNSDNLRLINSNSMSRKNGVFSRNNERVSGRKSFFRISNTRKEDARVQSSFVNNLRSRRSIGKRMISTSESQRRTLEKMSPERKEGLPMKSRRELKILSRESRGNRLFSYENSFRTKDMFRNRNIADSLLKNRNGRGLRGRISKRVSDFRIFQGEYRRQMFGRNTLVDVRSQRLQREKIENFSGRTQTVRRQTIPTRSLEFFNLQKAKKVSANSEIESIGKIYRWLGTYGSRREFRNRINAVTRQERRHGKSVFRFTRENNYPEKSSLGLKDTRRAVRVSPLAGEIVQKHYFSENNLGASPFGLKHLFQTSRYTSNSNRNVLSRRTDRFSLTDGKTRKSSNDRSDPNFRSADRLQRRLTTPQSQKFVEFERLTIIWKRSRIDQRISRVENRNRYAQKSNARKERLFRARLVQRSERERQAYKQNGYSRAQNFDFINYKTDSNEFTQGARQLAIRTNLPYTREAAAREKRMQQSNARSETRVLHSFLARIVPSSLPMKQQQRLNMLSRTIPVTQSLHRLRMSAERNTGRKLRRFRQTLDTRSQNVRTENDFVDFHSDRIRFSMKEKRLPSKKSESLQRRDNRQPNLLPVRTLKSTRVSGEEIYGMPDMKHFSNTKNFYGLFQYFSFRNNRILSIAFDVFLGLMILGFVVDDSNKGFLSSIKNRVAGQNAFHYFSIKA